MRALASIVVVAALLAGGCSRRPTADPWLVSVGEAHHEADRRQDANDLRGARALLDAVVERAASHPEGDRRLALQDTYFRLAHLALAAREPSRALAYADAGLDLGCGPHLFVANLYVARGAAREALGEGREAAADYHRALEINESLLREALPSR
jgi:tetratricopeptide (TPR) repeat protein